MPFTILSHTADTGVEATASTLPGLIEELARAMFRLMADDAPSTTGSVTVRVDDADAAELVVDALSELLYRSEVDDVLFSSFSVVPTDAGVEITASGVAARDVELTGPPVKAVTYHGLVVEDSADGWHGRVYFDV